MYKLKDIISSGGTNPKINKAIDRYELSKDEKKDIISTIKTNVPQSGGSGGGTEAIRYIKILNPGGLEIIVFTAAIVKCDVDGVFKFYPNGAAPANNIVAAGVILSESYQGLIDAGVKLEDAFTMMESGGAIQTITEEEFYTI